MADDEALPPAAGKDTAANDVDMPLAAPTAGKNTATNDAGTPLAAPAASLPAAPAGRSSTPTRGTPSRNVGPPTENSSRAASALPESPFVPPDGAQLTGAPVRRYLNANVTGPLLEGMKKLATEQPKDPLRVLGEFLLEKARQAEGQQ